MQRHQWKFALLILVPLALYAYIVERNSWLPKEIGVYADFFQFSPHGRYLALRGSNLIDDGTDSEIELFDTVSQRVVQTLKGRKVFFLGDNSIAVSKKRVEIYSVPDGKLTASSQMGFWADTALMDGKTFLGHMMKGGAEDLAWDSSKSSYKKFVPLPPRRFKNISRMFQLLPDNQTLLILEAGVDDNHYTYDMGMKLWDIGRKKICFSVKRRTAISCTNSGLCALQNPDSQKYEIWNYTTGQLQYAYWLVLPDKRFPHVNPNVVSVELSPDGALLAGYNRDFIGIWDTSSGELLRTLNNEGNSSCPSCMKFTPDGRTLAVATNGTVKLWRIK
jgi:WD40 repeat protein